MSNVHRFPIERTRRRGYIGMVQMLPDTPEAQAAENALAELWDRANRQPRPFLPEPRPAPAPAHQRADAAVTGFLLLGFAVMLVLALIVGLLFRMPIHDY